MQKPILITGALILILSVFFCVQGLSVKRLKRENDVLRAELQSLRTKPAEILDQQGALGPDQSELLRLRGVVAQLRQQLSAAEAMIESLTNSPAATNDSPVENYLINAHTNLAWGQTLVVGGWKLGVENRGVLFIQASNSSEGDSIHLHARLLETPEPSLSRAGLDEFKADSKQSSKKLVISGEETERLIGALTNAGAKLRANTHYNQRNSNKRFAWGGNQVVLSLTTENNPESGARWLSPSAPVLIVTPTVSPDRQSLHLTVSGLINYPRDQTRE